MLNIKSLFVIIAQCPVYVLKSDTLLGPRIFVSETGKAQFQWIPDRPLWYLTLYPSYAVRINYGDPVSGQTGCLFLPADLAIGYAFSEKVAMSLEDSMPIIKDYPVYDFKTEIRVVIKD